jgi:hypothetical protein
MAGMAIASVRCHVSGERVVRVSDLEGTTVQLCCPYLMPGSNVCRAKQRTHDSGRLAEFLERVQEDTLRSRDNQCELVQSPFLELHDV